MTKQEIIINGIVVGVLLGAISSVTNGHSLIGCWLAYLFGRYVDIKLDD